MIDWKTKKDPAHWSELCLCLLSLVRRGEVDWSVNRFYFVQASRLHISDKESTNTNRWISVQTLLLCLHWSWLLIWMSVLQSNQLVLTVFSCMRKPVHTTNSDQVKKISQSASFQACTHATLWKECFTSVAAESQGRSYIKQHSGALLFFFTLYSRKHRR